MKNEYIFDTLPSFPDCAPAGGICDTQRIKDRVHGAIDKKPAHRYKTVRRVLMIAAAAAIAAGVIFAGSSMVLGHDNYDPYSDEAKAVKAQLQSEYQSKYDQKLDELIARKESGQENDQDQNGTSNARWTAAHEMNLAVLKILQTGHVFIDTNFSESDIYQKEDEFINACCDAYFYGNLSTEDKTRIFIYLKGQTQTKDPYSGTYHERCSDQSYEKISETLKGYLDPPEHYTLEQLNDLAKFFKKEYKAQDFFKYDYTDDSEGQAYEFDQKKLDDEYRWLESEKNYRCTPEFSAMVRENDIFNKAYKSYLKNRLNGYKDETGINVIDPRTDEEYLEKYKVETECVSHFVGEYAGKILPVIKKCDPSFDIDSVDTEMISKDYEYMCEKYIQFYNIIMKTDNELSIDDRVLLDMFFFKGCYLSQRIKASDDMGFCIGDSYLEAYRTNISEKLGLTKEQLIAKYS